MKIVVLDGDTLNPGDNPWDGLAAVGEIAVYDRTEPIHVAERVKDAEILITNKAPLRRSIIEQLETVQSL